MMLGRNVVQSSKITSQSYEGLLRLQVYGFAIVFLMFVGFFTWASLATIQGAVIAPGVVVVESNSRKLQHPTGGIVGSIYVKEGQKVREGDLLVRLDETIMRANLTIINNQLSQLFGQRSRLIAERDNLSILKFLPSQISLALHNEEAARVIEGERNLFFARQQQRIGQKNLLRERIEQLKKEIEGLEAQQNAKEKEISLIQSELLGVEELYMKNLIPISRVTTLQREQTRLEGERGALMAQSASARGKVSELELQILNVDSDLQSEVARSLRETEIKISELEERRVAAEDQLRRIELRSPITGVIHQLNVHTVGGVIQPAETILQIVPSFDALVIEAKVSPNDIEPVHIGEKALIRLTSLNQRTTPELHGTVSHVAADLLKDNYTGGGYFLVRLVFSPSEIQKLGTQRLVPGMPAEAFIQTEPRTVLSYLLKPLSEQFMRAFRER